MAKAQTTKQACDEIGYTPADGFFEKPEKEQWAMIRSKRLEYARRDAVAVLGGFIEEDLFETLPEEIQDAIKLIAVKRTGGGGGGSKKNVFMDTLRSHLKTVGDVVDELDLFKDLKMGRGEIRAKIRENLKKAAPAERFWVELDADAECWELIGIGEEQPEGWAGSPIDEE